MLVLVTIGSDYYFSRYLFFCRHTSIIVSFWEIDYIKTKKVCYTIENNHYFFFKSLGGWNNNPTAVQFMASFRRLISRCGAESAVEKTGNVQAQDATEMVQASTYIPPDGTGEHQSPQEIFENYLITSDLGVYQKLGSSQVDREVVM